jgi:hypothetical protein
MNSELVTLTYEIEVQPGEKLSLPQSLIENIGAGSWVNYVKTQKDFQLPHVLFAGDHLNKTLSITLHF